MNYGTYRGKRRQNGCQQFGTALPDPSGRGDKGRAGVSWHQPATLASEIGVPASQLNEVLNAKRPLSAEMALLIGQALDLDAAPLLALQMKYNLLSAKRNKSFLKRLKEIPRIAAVL